MDLIDRQVAIEHLKKRLYETEFNSTAEYPYYQEIADNRLDAWMNEVPAVQPEIVRCKDCKYWTYIKRTNRYWCKTDDGLFDLNPSPDDFCSRAERREE